MTEYRTCGAENKYLHCDFERRADICIQHFAVPAAEVKTVVSNVLEPFNYVSDVMWRCTFCGLKEIRRERGK